MDSKHFTISFLDVFLRVQLRQDDPASRSHVPDNLGDNQVELILNPTLHAQQTFTSRFCLSSLLL